MIDNPWTSIEVRHQKLQVLGLDDAYTGNANLPRALKGLDSRRPTIGLSHIAEEADALWDHGVPIVFSGHTHAGQVTLARLHEFIRGKVIGHKYVHGLYGQRGGDRPGAVYVGACIGAAVMPVRLGVRGRREVAVFELGEQVRAEGELTPPALVAVNPSGPLRRPRHPAGVRRHRARRRPALPTTRWSDLNRASRRLCREVEGSAGRRRGSTGTLGRNRVHVRDRSGRSVSARFSRRTSSTTDDNFMPLATFEVVSVRSFEMTSDG